MRDFEKVFKDMDDVFKEMDKVFKQMDKVMETAQDFSGNIVRKLELGPWKPWFAWRPVNTVSGKRVWWTTIYRRTINTYVDHEDWTRYEYGNLFDVLKSTEK